MVRGYVYNADIWASVVGKNFEMTNSRLVGGILADRCCSVNYLLSFVTLLTLSLVIVAG